MMCQIRLQSRIFYVIVKGRDEAGDHGTSIHALNKEEYKPHLRTARRYLEGDA